MAQNKKIRNATSTKAGNIAFKSRKEKLIYRTLIDQGITPEYEKYTIVLWDGFVPITPFYDQETDKQYLKRTGDENTSKKLPRILVPKTDKIVGIRYTPDFYFKKGDVDVWIEVKGIENDVFYIKKKMFRKYLDDKLAATGQRSLFFEVYTKGQLLQALNIINDYVESITEN